MSPSPSPHNRLRVLRAERRVSQLDVSLAIHINQNRYWRIENGYTVPTSSERAALAKYFRVNNSDIFPNEIHAT